MLWAGSNEPKLLQKVINYRPATPTPLSDNTNPPQQGTAEKSSFPAGDVKSQLIAAVKLNA